MAFFFWKFSVTITSMFPGDEGMGWGRYKEIQGYGGKGPSLPLVLHFLLEAVKVVNLL